MKKWLSVLAIVGFSVTTVYGSGLGGFASYWDSKDADSTWGGGALLRIDLDENLQLDIRGSYYEFSDREFGTKWELEVIPIEAALMFKIPLDQQFNAYIGGGGGYYIADWEFSSPEGRIKVDIDDEFGFFAVGGIDVRVGDALSIFGEAKYTWLEYKKAKVRELGPERLDIDLDMNGIAVNIGLLLRF